MRRFLGASISQLGLKIIATICMVCYVMSKSVLQRGVLHLETYNTRTLLEAMSGGSSVMGIATLAIIMELLSGMALALYAFLLVEGFEHTTKYGRYLANLITFSVISEVLYDLAMTGKWFDFSSQNPMFGLVVSLIVLYGIRLIQKDHKKHLVFCIVMILAGCLWCYLLNVEFGIFCVLISAVFYLLRFSHGWRIFWTTVIGLPYITGILATYPIFCYNGKRGKKYNKYLFYLIYPVVLAIACLILNFTAGTSTLKSLEERVANSKIYIEKIDGLSEDFIRGMDVSSVLSEEKSGVSYQDEDGNTRDVFEIMEEAGVNYARIRVWNDPYDKDGNGYGGGNNDVATAVELGKRATKHHMAVNVDFHYSDFWADPSKQMAPKAWAHLTFEDKTKAIYDFTYESLDKMLDEKIDVQMVQIGNEINHGLAGETDFERITALLKSASSAVRDVAKEHKKEIKIAVHYTEIDNPANILKIAGDLEKAELDYDVFGVSYYTYWHGSMENLTQVLTDLKEQYQKDTCVMETSYMFTDADADGSANSVDASSALYNYPVSVQGQANLVRDVMAHANEAGSLGIFYWEGCWVAPSSNYDANKKIYEENGSGWASSYAGSYDKNDAGKYYGGCSWDNQAMFDSTGKALASLNVFSFVDCGATGGELEIIAIPDIEIEVQKGTTLTMPTEVAAIYNDSSKKDAIAVRWNAEKLAEIDTSKAGEYTVTGTTESGEKVLAYIKVASLNAVKNSSFEDSDMSVWSVTSTTGEDPTDVQKKAADAHTAEKSFHFWSKSAQDFQVQQNISDLAEGTYFADAFIQGGDVGSTANIYLYVVITHANGAKEELKSEAVLLDGWVNWKNPRIEHIQIQSGDSVTIGMNVSCKEKGWGTIDDFEFAME